MSRKNAGFQVLLERARQGSNEAAAELVQRFSAHVLAVVRKHMPRRVRPIYDSTDLTQEVWTYFFDKALPRHSFSAAKQVRAFLGKMAQNKTADVGRHLLDAQKGDLRREREFSTMPHTVERIADPRPGPGQLAEEREEWERRLLSQPEFMQQVLKLLRQHCGAKQIADQLGVNVRTVRRALRKLFPPYEAV